MTERRTIRTDYLARVEGEGSLTVQIDGGRVERAELRIFEPPRFFEALLRGRAFTEAPGHHRADLRDLPGRLPDERDERDGEPLRRRGPRADPHAAPAALLRRVDREPRAPHLHAARPRLPRLRRARSNSPATPPQIVERGLAAEEDRQRGDAPDRRARDPSDQRPRRRLLPGAVRARARRRSSSRSSGRARRRSRRSAGPPASTFPSARSSASWSRCRTPTSTRSSAGGSARTAGSTSAPAEYDEHFEEEHVERSTALHSRLRERGTYLCGPLARYTLNHEQLSPLARELAREAGLGETCRDPFRSIIVRSVELVYACDEALRLIDAYEEPDAPAVDGRTAGRAAATAPARRRAECSTTATASTATARSSTRRSCRRPRRTSRRSRTTCAAWSSDHLELDDERAAGTVRADDPQLRPLHLLRHPLPAAWR